MGGTGRKKDILVHIFTGDGQAQRESSGDVQIFGHTHIGS